MYQALSRISKTYFPKQQHRLFKLFFNLSPMYRRTTGRVVKVERDFSSVEVKIPLSYKNKNYVGTIFGGSLFAATDPIYMVQLIQILGKDYVVWDKSSMVKFKRPANSDAFAAFAFTEDEISKLKADISEKKEVDLIKPVLLKSKDGKLFCEIEKVIYVADKQFYKEKKARKQ
ncbi:DUF4442 domain-containing protein [Ekhidna sp. MALMAid0563]|uniref:DUF4442 domain-containing protein n=1 Tax=Ekhidna sp. MALMAid0563 TaxID=3143937 RepID=UPI0032DEE8F9